ncbi:hypothetical protein NHH03_27805 [Stieleria sp. TO1_6]|uniref:hypothetical protein n=1 Tax=Stieleria tagensis TaxID=2956795 RepID=UPI00209B59FF|nr:hypothetical protein [Stieleria tagensis]MCO8125576.1 hypothetical protein [Stieleria tagensis]
MIQKPKTDPIVDGIHAVRCEISDRFGGDVRAIAADANARMLASGCLIWEPTGNHPMQPSGEVGRVEVDDQPSPPADR